MKALILAGGFGTRMRPLTDSVPKSLLPIANRPFLEHQVRLLAEHGITNATLLTGYLADDFAPLVERMRARGIVLTISTEATPLDTAGAVRSVLDHLDDTTMVFNGDILTDLDMTAMMAFHRARAAALTIALAPVDDARAYGLVARDERDGVTAFLEKPAEITAGWINAGTYILEPKVLERIPADTPWSFERQLFPDLVAESAPVFGFASGGYWLDIGTPARYLQAHVDVLSGRVRVSVDGQIMTDARTWEDGTSIVPPVLLAHARVAAGAVLGPFTTLGARASIGAGARIESSVIHGGAVVGARAIVRESILGPGANVPDDSECIAQIIA